MIQQTTQQAAPESQQRQISRSSGSRQLPRRRLPPSGGRKTTVFHGPKLRIVPLGGLEGIGKNMAFLEYGNDIIIIDAGIMFAYEDMPGVDYIIPDITYLQKNRDRIRGIVITHGHLDHMGAIPYIIKRIGNPPIFGAKLTIALIKDRLEEFQLDRVAKLNVFDVNDHLKLGVFGVTFFRVNHNIPDSVGVVVKTPVGTVVHTGDFKFDHTPSNDLPAEFGKIARVGNDGVLVAMSDSTNAEEKGYAISEKDIGVQLELLISKAPGRIIVSTFASLLSRMQQVIDASVKNGRKVAFSGRSMEKTAEIATKLGYLKFSPSSILKLAQISHVPSNRLTILSTGSQGQEKSALGRMSRGEHRQVQIQKTDTVILSSSPIPGNERAIARVMNGLVDLGANVIYNKIFDVHSSGHARQEELKLMLALLKPKFFIPVHGERFMLKHHGEIAESIGVLKGNVFVMSNGEVLEVGSDRAQISNVHVPAELVLVDGAGIGDPGNLGMHDRQVMAQDGLVVVVATIDGKTGKLAADLDVVPRGFAHMNGSDHLIVKVKERMQAIVNTIRQEDKEAGWTPLKNRIRDDIGNLLYKETECRPIILPVVIEV